MSGSSPISLLIPPEPSTKSHDLQAQIQQIVSQKGHFRHVTEQSLQTEIRTKAPLADAATRNNLSEDQGTLDEDEVEDETPQKRQERLWKRRDDMLEKLSYAQNEILCALDFVSLLISKQSAPAQTSMSPALKEAVPIGTLASHVLQHKPPTAVMRKQLQLASQGWKSHSFSSAAQKLSIASTRLQADAEKESKYWAQVADLTARGWPISRLPRDTKAVGVHFGFPEAAPQFRDRGFALLRQSEDGTVNLDLQRRQRRLGVHITRKGTRTGSFNLHATLNTHRTSLHQQITDARDSLFEEELFYELGREARLIANQDVVTRGQIVEVAIGSQSHISFIFGEDHDDHGIVTAKDDETAEFVGLCLRLLLNAAHDKSLARRSQRPPVMTLKARLVPEYPLVRPILAHLRHRAQLTAVLSSCNLLIQVLTKAGLKTAFTTQDSTINVFKSFKMDSSDTMLSHVMLPARTEVEVILPSTRKLRLGFATFIGPPLFGTRFESSELDFEFCTIPASQHETPKSMLSFIRHVFLLDLVAHTATRAEKPSAKPQAPATANSKQWTVSEPHNGELALHEIGAALAKLQISVQAQSCSIKVTPALATTTSIPTLWTWTQQGCLKGDDKGVIHESASKFDDVIVEIHNIA